MSALYTLFLSHQIYNAIAITLRALREMRSAQMLLESKNTDGIFSGLKIEEKKNEIQEIVINVLCFVGR